MWAGALQHVGRGSDETVRVRLGRFTEDDLSSSPILALAAAGSSLAAGDLDEAERWTSLADRAPRDTDVVEAGVAIMQAAIGRQGVAKMGSDAARARTLLDADSPWNPLCLFYEGVALHLTGERARARERLQEAAHRAVVPAPMFQALCLAQLALLATDEGDTGRAGVLAREQWRRSAAAAWSRCPMMALVVAVSAAVRAEQGRADEARRDLATPSSFSDQIVDPSPWYEVECRILLARATLRLNGLTAARELLADRRRPAGRTPDADVLDRVARAGPSRGRPCA